jgi:hypothetical protein
MNRRNDRNGIVNRREYLWFAGMLIALLAIAATRSPDNSTASATLLTGTP